MNKEAIRLFTETYIKTAQSFFSIINFRSVAKLGVASVAEQVSADEHEKARELFTAPENDRFFLDKAEVMARNGGIEGLGRRMAKSKVRDFHSTVDGASLVFAQTVVDGAALDLCNVIALVEPTLFLGQIGKKSVELNDVLAKPAAELVKGKLDEYLKTLDRASLLAKIDLIFSICQPPEGFTISATYTYDGSRLARLDKARHSVIHKIGPTILPEIDSDIEFLRDTSVHLAALLQHRFGIHMDMQYFPLTDEDGQPVVGPGSQLPPLKVPIGRGS